MAKGPNKNPITPQNTLFLPFILARLWHTKEEKIPIKNATSVITIICDMIERFSEKQRVEDIKDFQGIVLIDEIELHLHPKWQYSFMNKLRETFPLIQFIVTTHSSTVLLGAGIDAVYYQIYKENGTVKISKQKEVRNDYINDIQTSIFGFDVNEERIHNPTNDDKKRQQRTKESLLKFIDTLDEEE